MEWDDDLLTDQKEAAIHVGTHARLLAGPGTGKTRVLTRRILFLVSKKNILPEHITAITFTRAAAHELLERVTKVLNGDEVPQISTLHSFALRQILRNDSGIGALPRPLRIADDWEERHIVLEDLKVMLGLQRINEADKLLKGLSSDWESLSADKEDWEKHFPDPKFLGAWQEHRKIYGYTLRAELVYQLKKALEQRGNFKFESPIKFLLVDEYQDLNHCDLAVIKSIASRGTELFVAGDDDQSIYGFRNAHPEGIRRFKEDYPDAADLKLATCMRCDHRILKLGLFVARQDFRRIEKNIQARPDCGEGEVEILGFNNQNEEAQGIADLCIYLVTQKNLAPDDILILLRSDRHGIFSTPILEKFEGTDIRVVVGTNTGGVLDKNAGRAFLSFLRLSVTAEDSLAWRSVLKIWCDGIGQKSIHTLYDLACSREESFAQTVVAAHTNEEILPPIFRSRLSRAISNVFRQLEALFPRDNSGVYETHDQLMDVVRSTARFIVQDEQERDSILVEWPGGISPPGSHRTVREPLNSHGSYHAAVWN